MEKHTFPNFFIIGAPKSGTTALSEYLRTHPNVFFSDPKEPGYFATDFKFRLVNNDRKYLRLFKDVDESKHCAVGEGSTNYLFSKTAVSNIERFHNGPKFIVMIRNPIDMVLSFHNQQLITGNENLISFSDAWQAEPDRSRGKRIPLTNKDSQLLLYSKWGMLGTQLLKLFDQVERKRVLVILFDDFIQDPGLIYREVLSFLSIVDDNRQYFPVLNQGRSIEHVLPKKIHNLLLYLWMPFRTHLLNGQGSGLGDWILNMFTSERKKEVSEDIFMMLSDFYSDEVKILENILQRDFRKWLEKKEFKAT
jgi:hypothetical protein